MKSMTGYGRGECAREGMKFTVELNSVNRKQNDILINLPRELIELEPRIRDEINTRVSRGRLNVVVACHLAPGKTAQQVEIDRSLAKAYVRAVHQLGKEMKLAEGL